MTTICQEAHVGQIVVEVNVGCTEVASQEGGMGSEDGGDVHLPQLQDQEPYAREPLVEVSNDHRRRAGQTRDKLGGGRKKGEVRRGLLISHPPIVSILLSL